MQTVVSDAPPQLHHYTELLRRLGIDPQTLAAPNRPAKARSTTPWSAPLPRNVITIGNRNNSLASIAGSMRAHGADEATILNALLVHNAQHVQPPLGEDEVAGIARSISQYAPGPLAAPQAQSLHDTGNARRMVDQHGEGLRHVAGLDTWLIWREGHW